jgi:hypothetical protein
MRPRASEQAERYSRAASLTVLEIDVDCDVLLPAYLIANMMSPALWAWRDERRAHARDGAPLGVRRRLKGLERQFHRYTFTNIPGEPGGDPWGLLYFPEEERRLGEGFVRGVRADYDAALRAVLAQSPDSQFGNIVNQDYYRAGYFPRLRNELIETMDAYAGVSHDGKASGKCVALALLWAAALIVWGRFSPGDVILIGNRSHLFVYLDQEEGHLFNNTRWFSRTRIHNSSEVSELVRMVTTGSETTFLYNPWQGMCHCTDGRSTIAEERLDDLCGKVQGFLASPLKQPDASELRFAGEEEPLLDPRSFACADDFQSAVWILADRRPGSAYDFAQYAFRRIDVPRPDAYVLAALRDYHTKRAAASVATLEDAVSIVKSVRGRRSVFGSRGRVALPDETLYFDTGDDRDRALLLFTLLAQSRLADPTSVIGFSEHNSYVRHDGRWIECRTLSHASSAPRRLTHLFNGSGSSRRPYVRVAPESASGLPAAAAP